MATVGVHRAPTWAVNTDKKTLAESYDRAMNKHYARMNEQFIELYRVITSLPNTAVLPVYPDDDDHSMPLPDSDVNTISPVPSDGHRAELEFDLACTMAIATKHCNYAIAYLESCKRNVNDLSTRIICAMYHLLSHSRKSEDASRKLTLHKEHNILSETMLALDADISTISAFLSKMDTLEAGDHLFEFRVPTLERMGIPQDRATTLTTLMQATIDKRKTLHTTIENAQTTHTSE